MFGALLKGTESVKVLQYLCYGLCYVKFCFDFFLMLLKGFVESNSGCFEFIYLVPLELQ